MTLDKENLLDHIYVDYNVVYDHESHACFQEGVCRCGKITKIDRIIVDIDKLSMYIFNKFKQQKFYERYAKFKKIIMGPKYDVEKTHTEALINILNKNKIQELKKWDIIIENMYYGEEVVKAFIKDDVLRDINRDLFLIYRK